jgi:hypothetical protein
LPDGVFSNQKSQFGKILEGLRMETVGVFYSHLDCTYYALLVYFMVISLFCGNLVWFSPIWFIVSRKIWQPCCSDIYPAPEVGLSIFRKEEK